jgi:spore coat protein U-like protein
VNRINVAKAFAFAALAIAFLINAVGPAFANSFKLRGTMETVCEVKIGDLSRNLNLGKGETAVTVGTVNEQCNKAGFIVGISSTNRGALVDQRGNRIPYQVQYDGSGLLTLSSQWLWLRLAASVGQNNKELRITVPARPQATAGDYSDTIIVTIAAL